ASVAATCIALASVFTALLEPLLNGSRFNRRDLALGIVVLPGVALVVGGVPDDMHIGIIVGTVSALLVSVFVILNTRLVNHGDPLTVTALELGAGTLSLTALAPAMPWIFPAFAGDLLEIPGAVDIAWLLVLSIGCTLLPFALSLVALRHMSAFAAQLAVNLEPVYAIVLAIVLLGEQHELSPAFYLGVAIVLLAVVAYPILARGRPAAGAARVEHPELLGTAESKQIVD